MDPDQRLHQKNSFPLLVIEGNKDHQLIISYCLRERAPQIEPMFADTVQDALSFLSLSAVQPIAFPRLVIQSLFLPQIAHGFDLLTEIRSRYPVLPVIVLSSHQEASTVIKAYEMGAHSFLGKPSSLDHWEYIFQSLNDYWLGTVTLPDKL
ncbi:response regulator [Spirosoma sp. HMF3257]|uniref:Response regulator n=1 Tax=Spirosoma telluris TaxID=2183553 RepID=A0A327NGX0_9BACT|nr:response regulator [Spirosoma telluris]RAI74043.1 response regulator [Spirosoma telluris]